jgi:hypothetical protein
MTTQAETNVIKLAVDNPLATPEDVAAIEFDAAFHRPQGQLRLHGKA